MELRNILVCGLGGVGGYFGGMIAHSLNRLGSEAHMIYFLARGQHLEEIKTHGLRLNTSDNKRLTCTPTLASDRALDFPSPDVCVICVKSYHLPELLHEIKEIVTENTIIIPLMNGIDIYERIRGVVKTGILLPTCVYVGSHVEEPGLVIQSGNPGFFRSGPDPQHSDFNPQPLMTFFETMGIKLIWESHPYVAIWQKYLLVSSFGLVCAVTGQTMGNVINSKDHLKILKLLMHEIILIAEKQGVALSPNIIEETIEFCKDYPDVKPSYQRDVENRRKNEGDLFGGTIIQLGKKFGVPTPITTAIFHKIYHP